MGKRKGSEHSHNKTPKKKVRISSASDPESISEMTKVPSSKLSETRAVVQLVRKVQQVYAAHANSKDAFYMKKYMRGQFEYFGIRSPLRKTISKEFLQTKLDKKQTREFVQALWELPEREFHSFGLSYLEKHIQELGSSEEDFEVNMEFVKHLLTTKPWWDTVDNLASHIVSHLVKEHPIKGKAVMEEWIGEENMWLRRTAILHQLPYKESTDKEMLFRFCASRAHEREFFIQKSIGWALRQYARFNAVGIKVFLRKNKKELSKLSYREASKHLTGM